MAKVLTLRQALKIWLWTIAAVIAILASSQLADNLMHADHPTLFMRWLAVTFATISALPMLGVIVWGYGVSDEFWRQIVLVGTAVGFALYVLIYTAFAAMQDVGLVSHDAYLPFVPVAALVWLAGVTLTAFYYRLRP